MGGLYGNRGAPLLEVEVEEDDDVDELDEMDVVEEDLDNDPEVFLVGTLQSNRL